MKIFNNGQSSSWAVMGILCAAALTAFSGLSHVESSEPVVTDQKQIDSEQQVEATLQQSESAMTVAPEVLREEQKPLPFTDHDGADAEAVATTDRDEPVHVDDEHQPRTGRQMTTRQKRIFVLWLTANEKP